MKTISEALKRFTNCLHNFSYPKKNVDANWEHTDHEAPIGKQIFLHLF